MGASTAIEWTDATWNPVGGCTIKSPGCINCYAQALAGTRLAKHPLYAGTTDIVKGKPVFNGKLTAVPSDHHVWTWPLRWRGARAPLMGPGQPSTIFVGDMSDLFHEGRLPKVIDRVFAVGALCLGRHVLQLLTKRPDVMLAYIANVEREAYWMNAVADLFETHPGTMKPCYPVMGQREPWQPLPNVWLGTSVERQKEADERREPMRRLAAMGWTTFVSYEPALGPVDWSGWGFLAQIISGGESGRHDARPSHPDWHRAARDFCQANGIAYFFKQWGEWKPCPYEPPHDPRTERLLDDGTAMIRAGKKAAGRLLDGREWNEMPIAREPGTKQQPA